MSVASWRGTLLVMAAFLAVALALYAPALHGQPFSEDLLFLQSPYLRTWSAENLLAILDPRGAPSFLVFNYSPVHSLLHGLDVRLFGDDPFGHHVVNVILHAVVSALLAALLLRTGIPLPAALLGATIFLVHPANVEAVAWIFQLKTTAAAAFAMGALLAHPRRPWLGALLFALALLTKAHAALALPVLALLEWCRAARGDAAQSPPRRAWLGVWAGLLVGFALAELPIFAATGRVERPLFSADPLLHARFVVAVAARYAVMAATGTGLSAFHEPSLVVGWGDPWWIGGLALLGILGTRFAAVLRRRSTEAAWWMWAAAGFAPVSQVTPFIFPIADRYLYFVLPGLLGGVLMAGHEALSQLGHPVRRRAVVRALAGAAAVLALVFAASSATRARIWQTPAAVYADAARHYPDGMQGRLAEARERARAGDVDGTIAALRAASARGWTAVGQLFVDRDYAGLRRDPRFEALVRELTEGMVAPLLAHPNPTAAELQMLAQLHLWRGESDAAEKALERVARGRGPEAAGARATLRALRAGRVRGEPEPAAP
jgi:hypothetical protein